MTAPATASVRVKSPRMIRLLAARQSFTVEQVGVITPKFVEVEELSVGEVGFVVAGDRDKDCWKEEAPEHRREG